MTPPPRQHRLARRDHSPQWIHRRGGREPERGGRAGLLGVLLVCCGALTLLLEALALATAPAAAQHTLRAVTPALLDLDQALAAHGDTLSGAVLADEDQALVPGLAVNVRVTGATARQGSAAVRAAVAEQAARALYERGPAFLHERAEGVVTAPRLLSRQWQLERTLGLLQDSTHERVQRWALIGAVLVLGLVLALALTVEPARVSAAIGAAAAGAALLALVVFGLLRVVLWLVATDATTAGRVVQRAGRDVFMTGLAAAAIVGGTGLLVVVVTAGGGWLERALATRRRVTGRTNTASKAGG